MFFFERCCLITAMACANKFVCTHCAVIQLHLLKKNNPCIACTFPNMSTHALNRFYIYKKNTETFFFRNKSFWLRYLRKYFFIIWCNKIYRPISIEHGTKHLWVKGIQVWPHPFSMGDNNKIAKIH